MMAKKKPEPAGLGERGSRLYESLSSGDLSRDALALEAARTVDRLDELDSIIQGKGVLNLMQFRLEFPSDEDGSYTVEVKFNAVLAEARQQGAALLGLVKVLGVSGAVKADSDEGRTPLQLLKFKMEG